MHRLELKKIFGLCIEFLLQDCLLLLVAHAPVFRRHFLTRITDPGTRIKSPVISELQILGTGFFYLNNLNFEKMLSPCDLEEKMSPFLS